MRNLCSHCGQRKWKFPESCGRKKNVLGNKGKLMGVMLSHAPWTFWWAGVPSWTVCLFGWLYGGLITTRTALMVCVCVCVTIELHLYIAIMPVWVTMKVVWTCIYIYIYRHIYRWGSGRTS